MERGDAYQIKGDYDLAIADYARILAIQPNNTFAQQRKQAAEALKQAGGSVSSAPGPKPAVVAVPAPPLPQAQPAPKAPSAVPIAQETDVAKLFSLAETLYRKGDIDGSMAALNRIAAIDANNPKVYLYRGEVRIRKGELEQAAADLDRAIELNPSSVDAHILRCAALLDLGRLDAAMADGEHLVRVAGKRCAQLQLPRSGSSVEGRACGGAGGLRTLDRDQSGRRLLLREPRSRSQGHGQSRPGSR